MNPMELHERLGIICMPRNVVSRKVYIIVKTYHALD